jgi:predicted transcriptional regulator of viral defense system
MKKNLKIKTLFLKRGGVLTTKELKEAGVSYYFIQKMLQNEQIERIKRGVYRWAEGTEDEWVEVSKIVPHGIFCLFSAALLYDLSTFVPSGYHVAIPWKDKVRLPDYPPIKLYFWKDAQYELGKTTHQRNAFILPVYDLEKTVCDFIKFRNKVGLDVTKEVIRNYLARRDRNLNTLMDYSRQLKISSVVEQYIEVLV